jgi:hypothetical protein
MKFKATLSNTVKVITTISFLLVPVAVYTIMTSPELTTAYRAVLITTFAGLLVVTYLYSITGYTVDTDFVIVNRPLYNVKIKRSDITEHRVLTDEEMKWSIRTFGVGGLFGYLGRFTNSNIGSMTWYATRRGNYVLLVAGGKKIVLTPDEPQAFIAALGN